MDDLILTADRCHIRAVEVDISCRSRHRAIAGAGRRSILGRQRHLPARHIVAGAGGQYSRQIVLGRNETLVASFIALAS
jgi:hypothetical protein